MREELLLSESKEAESAKNGVMAVRNGTIMVLGVSSAPGLGLSVSRKFAREGYRVGMIGRTQENLERCAGIIREEKEAAKVQFKVADVGNAEDLSSALDSLAVELCDGAHPLRGIVYNASARPFPKSPVHEIEIERRLRDVAASECGFISSVRWALPRIKDNDGEDKDETEARGVVLVTGATASMRGSANFGSFCASKGALRDLAMSLAKEQLKEGIHVAHIIVDGMIDMQVIRTMMQGTMQQGRLIDPDAIADVYWFLFNQKRSCFTFELDVRPSLSDWS